MPALTKTAIDGAAPRNVPFMLWDIEPGGFGCRVFPSGKRSFVLQYRMPGTRKKLLLTLGGYGELTVRQGRDKARDALAEIRRGENPQAAKNARQASVVAQASTATVAALVQQYKAALQAGTAATKRLRGRQASTGYFTDTVLQLNRFADACGAQPADSLTRRDVIKSLNTFIKQPSAHRRMHGAIHRMYAWARKQDLLTNNPTADIDTSTPPARERTLSLEELARIWRAAETLEPLYSDIVKLMIATGQRRNEVAGMCWGEIDLTRAMWTLPPPRTKPRRQHALPLPPRAMALLQARRAAFQRPPAPDDLVLPTLARDGRSFAPVSGWNWLKRELDKTSGLADWQLHDFRRSIVTICAEHGVEVATLDSMLNHASSATRGGVIGVYQRATLLEPMRRVMALWDRLLQTALAQADGSNVVALLRD